MQSPKTNFFFPRLNFIFLFADRLLSKFHQVYLTSLMSLHPYNLKSTFIIVPGNMLNDNRFIAKLVKYFFLSIRIMVLLRVKLLGNIISTNLSVC